MLSKVSSCSSVTSAPKGKFDRALKSIFATGISTSFFKNFEEGSPHLPERIQMMTLSKSRFQRGTNGFINQETSSGTFIQGRGYGQPQISYKPTTMKTNGFQQAINIGGTRNTELLNGFSSFPNFRYNNNNNLRIQNPGFQMGFAGGETSDGHHDIHTSLIRNYNGNKTSVPPMLAGNFSDSGQEVLSRSGSESENQLPPKSTNVIQRKNTLAWPLPPWPQPLFQQESCFEVPGGEKSNLPNQIMDTSLQYPFCKDNLDDNFLKWVNDLFPDQVSGYACFLFS